MTTQSTDATTRWASENFVWGFPVGAMYSWQENFASYGLRSIDLALLVIHEDDFPPAFVFSSSHLNHLPPEQAQGRADALLAMLNGLLCLQCGPSFVPFSITRCVDLQTDTNAHVNPYAVPVLDPFPEDHERLRYTGDRGQTLSPDGKIFFVSRYDAHIRYLLQMFGRERITFVSLYKALDTMKDAGFSEAQMASCVKDKEWDAKQAVKDIDNFRFTANKFQGAGLDARHGFQAAVQAKAKTLTIQQAADVMCPIILAFIGERVQGQFNRLWSSVVHVPGAPQPGPALPRYVVGQNASGEKPE